MKKLFSILAIGLFSLYSFGQTSEGLQKINGTQLYVKVIGAGSPY